MKYPRTPHFPFSPGASSDDTWFEGNFSGHEVVVTEKLDGECTGMTRDKCHARSLDSKNHPSRHWVRQLHSTICGDIPEGWKIFGENVYAYHSIFYTEMPSYFMVYGIYDDSNFCIPWSDTVELCQMLGLVPVPVIYQGPWDEKIVRTRWTGKGAFPTYSTKVDYPKSIEDFTPTEAEGYVVRSADRFLYNDFALNVCKWVRANHVQTDQNWMSKPVFKNLLIGD